MKGKISPKLLLLVELILTACAFTAVIIANISVVRSEADQYTARTAEDYADLENRYISVFKAIAIQAEDALAQNPSFDEMSAWLQARDSQFGDAIGSVYDGFAMTYQGGYAHSWNYGDYSNYDPSRRIWYQAAQAAGGEVAVVAPYVTYTGSQYPNSDQYIELSIVQKYSNSVSFDLDLKIYEINALFSDAAFQYSGTTALLFDKSGYILSTTDSTLYCHNINVSDDAVSGALSGLLISMRENTGKLVMAQVDGVPHVIYASQDAAGNTYCILIPLWSVISRNFLVSSLILLLLVLLEVAIYLNNRRIMGEMSARDQMITAITRSAFQRQVYVDLSAMTCVPDEQSRGMMPPSMSYRAAFERLRADVVGKSQKREFDALLSPGSLLRAEGKGLLSRKFTFDIPRGELPPVRKTLAMSVFVAKLNGKRVASILGNDVTDEERSRRQIAESIAHHYNVTAVGSTDGDVLEIIKQDDRWASLAAPELSMEELHRQYAEKFLKSEYVADYLAAVSRQTVEKRLSQCDGYSFTAQLRDGHWQTFRIIRGEGYEENRRFVFFAENADEQMRRQAELTAALDQANAAARSKDDFLSRMSHDIRTPMNGIIGMTRIAREQQDLNKVRACLDKIETASRFLLGLVNEILDMAKVENGKIELHPEPYPIGEFTSYLDSVIRPQCAEKGLFFQVNVRPLEDRVPLMDKVRCNQVVLNLLSNSLKFTPAGGTVTFGLYETPTPEGGLSMEVRVADTGIGISEEFQKTMFEPFAQEHRDDVAENRGTGLGLSIVQRLTALMDGTIQVHSKPGEGTEFILRGNFDCVPADPTAVPASGEIRRDWAALAGVPVLLCEDHPLNREIALTLLGEKHMAVTAVPDGKQAVEAFAASAPGFYRVILMDIRMPVMDGYEASRTIRALPRSDAGTVPILAMTADAFADDVRKCRDAGMDGHIAKPIDPEQMFDVILHALEAGRES